MNLLQWLKFFFSRSNSPKGPAQDRSRRNAEPGGGRHFSSDYNDAMLMLNPRINKSFPDNYQAGFDPDRDHGRDYGDDRAAAIDTASAAVAAALREGATVKQAAEAGATSIGV